MPKIVEKVELVCLNCNATYYKPPSKAKNSKYCSRVCMNRFQANAVKKEREHINCKYCKKTFEKIKGKERTYCSIECNKKDVKRPVLDLQCEYCKKPFQRIDTRVTKFCGKECQYKAQSSGTIEIPSSGRMGFRRDLNPNYFFKSSLEADYARYCNEIGKPYIYEHKTFEVEIEDGNIKMYTPDFYHPDENKYVETKAIRRDAKYSGNLSAAEVLQNNGVDLEIMLMSDFYKMLRKKGLYYSIDNLENKNYLGTRGLIYLRAKK